MTGDDLDGLGVHDYLLPFYFKKKSKIL